MWPSLRRETMFKDQQLKWIWAKRYKKKKPSDKLKKNKAVQVFSASHSKNITSSQKNGNMMLFLNFTTVKTLPTLLILTFGKNLKNSKENKISYSKWKEWKSRKIWPQKSIKKLKKLSTKSREKNTHSEKTMLWKDAKPPFTKTYPCKSSNKSWNKRASTLPSLKKEWEIEANQNPWPN